MMYPRLRRNKFLTKLLEGARHMWNNEIPSLTLSQILWRQENRNDLIGCIGKRSLFRTIPVFLLKRKDGGYVLFAPSSKKDDIPCYLYDILNIQEHSVSSKGRPHIMPIFFFRRKKCRLSP